MARREFTVADEYVYNRAGPVRWVISHVLRYKRFLLGAGSAMIVANVLLAAIPRIDRFKSEGERPVAASLGS